MVKYADVLSANSTYFSSKPSSDFVAVFVGATNGIGLGALRALAKYTSGSSPTLYVVGRSQATLDSIQKEIAALNPTANFVPIQANDLTLVKDAQAAAEKIKTLAESGPGKIDFLFLTPGYVSLHRDESPEGLDRVTAIRFYSRVRFLLTLTPLLLKAAHPHVVSVLAAGKEGKLFPDDWLLKKNYSVGVAGDAASSMTTLFLEEFSKKPENAKIGLTYTFPGIVGGTGLTLTGLPWWAQPLFNWIAKPLLKLVGASIDQAGERTLYAATYEKLPSKAETSDSAAKGSDGTVGSGVYLLDGDSSVIPGNKTLTELREQGLGEKVWEHTIETLGSIESS